MERERAKCTHKGIWIPDQPANALVSGTTAEATKYKHNFTAVSATDQTTS